MKKEITPTKIVITVAVILVLGFLAFKIATNSKPLPPEIQITNPIVDENPCLKSPEAYAKCYPNKYSKE